MAAHASERTLVALLVGLTVVTGLVDAASYLLLGRVFVANMTGNVVFIAFALAGAQGFSIPASVLALAAFVVGAIVGGRASRRSAPGLRLVVLGTTIEAVLMALAVIVAALLPISDEAWPRYLVVVLLGVALGTQNAVVRALGVRDLTTTVLTLTLTGIGADSSPAGGSNSGLSRRLASVVAMFGGAVVGTLAVLHGPPVGALALPLVGVVGVAVVAGVTRRER